MKASLAAIAPAIFGTATLAVLICTSSPDLTSSPSNEVAGFFHNVTWNARSIATVIVTFSVSALANAAGVGGGGFLVPLFNLVLGESLKGAMALSQAAITGGAVAAGFIALFHSHPLDDTQPLLDLEVALVLLPCLLLGVTLGVTMNEVFPDWLLVIILTILLVLISLRTLRSGLRLHAAELRSEEENAQENLLISASSELPALSPKGRPSMDRSFSSPQRPQPPDAEAPASSSVDGLPLSELLLNSHPVRIENSNPSSLASSPMSDASGHVAFTTALQAEQQQAGKTIENAVHTAAVDPHSWLGDSNGDGFHFQTPFLEDSGAAVGRRWKSHLWQSLRLLLLIGIWAAFLGLQLAKDRFATCSGPYFGMLGAQAGLCLLASAAAIAVWALHGARSTSAVELPLLVSQPLARPQASTAKLLLAAFAVLAGGALAALCGLGGGMVLGPIMLELGLHPMVAASTSLLLVGASSSSASVEFALVDRLPYGWGVIMFGLCAVAGVVGSSIIGRVVRASGRASAIVFLLVFVMAAGGVLTAVFGGIRAFEALEHGGRFGFISICEH